MRVALRSLTLLVAIALSVGVVTGVPAAEPPIEINAILSLTGPLAFLGASEARSLQVAETVVNRANGVNGRPVHFTIEDDQSSPALGVQLASALIAKKVAVILGPTFGSVCNAIFPLVTNGPVLFCYSAVGHTVSGGYMFSPTMTTAQNMAVGISFLRRLGLKRLALATSNDATGIDLDAAVSRVLALPENRSIELVAREYFGPTDLSVAAQAEHIRAANPEAVIVGCSGPPFTTFLHALSDAAVSTPVFSPNSNMTLATMKQSSNYLPPKLYFASYLGQAHGSIGPGPIRDAQTVFDGAMRNVNVDRPDTGNVVIWDAALMVVDAYRHFGPNMTAAQLHDWLGALHGWTGINGVYDFRGGNQHGIYEGTNLLVFRWDAARQEFVAASHLGGAPLR